MAEARFDKAKMDAFVNTNSLECPCCDHDRAYVMSGPPGAGFEYRCRCPKCRTDFQWNRKKATFEVTPWEDA